MKVWVVQRECGDYYCGCGGGHIAGIYTDQERAEQHASRLPRFERKVTEVETDEPYELRPSGETWT